jgi:hypothetical protein
VNELKQHVEFKRKESEQATKLSQVIDKLASSISADFTGNDPGYLFNATDKTLIKQFVVIMNKNKWANSENLQMYVKKTKRKLSGTEMTVGPSKYGIKNKLRKLTWVKLWSGQGFLLGVFHDVSRPTPSNSTKLYICSDGKIRLQRYYPVFPPKQSFAYGYGTLPDKKILSRFQFDVGYFEDNDVRERLSFCQINLNSLLKRYIDLTNPTSY